MLCNFPRSAVQLLLDWLEHASWDAIGNPPTEQTTQGLVALSGQSKGYQGNKNKQWWTLGKTAVVSDIKTFQFKINRERIEVDQQFTRHCLQVKVYEDFLKS